MATPQQIATEVNKNKNEIAIFSVLAVVCAFGVINIAFKQYDSKLDIIGFISSLIFKEENSFETHRFVYYAIGLAGLGLLYYAYKLYPLTKIMN
jgi:hypothetical protein